MAGIEEFFRNIREDDDDRLLIDGNRTNAQVLIDNLDSFAVVAAIFGSWSNNMMEADGEGAESLIKHLKMMPIASRLLEIAEFIKYVVIQSDISAGQWAGSCARAVAILSNKEPNESAIAKFTAILDGDPSEDEFRRATTELWNAMNMNVPNEVASFTPGATLKKGSMQA